MSIFSPDLEKGGCLREVVDVLHFCYPNGKSVLLKNIYSDETIQSNPVYQGVYEGNDYVPCLDYIDKFSHWPIFPDGFLCNHGKISYRMIFSKSFQETFHGSMCIDCLPLAILNGHIETMFIPLLAVREMDELNSGRVIKNYEWWGMVKTAIKEGIESSLDPKVNAKVCVETDDRGNLDGNDKHIFYITLKIYGHEDVGDIFWPYSDNEYDRHGQLFGLDDGGWFDDRWRGYCYRPKVGTPVSITTRLGLKYKQTK